MQVPVAQCRALRTSTQKVEVSIPPEEDRKNFWHQLFENDKTSDWNCQNYRIARWTSDPDVAGSNPTYFWQLTQRLKTKFENDNTTGPNSRRSAVDSALDF